LKYVAALKEPPLTALWLSQVLSGIGDQLYMLAAMWIAVERFGSQAGYVAAAIGVGRITFGLFGGVIADRHSRKQILVLSDLIRFFAVLPLPIIASRGSIEIWHLVVTGAIMGSMGAFFDPALQSALPSITTSQMALEAMTGLMDLTQRLARALGPGLTGLLVAVMPITQFFTIESISFLISALTILAIGARLTWNRDQAKVPIGHYSLQRVMRDLADGFKAAGDNRALCYCLFNLIVQAGLWGIAFTVGIPILVKQVYSDNVANYGYLVAAYGVGSVLGNVLCANLHVRSTWFNVFAADAICGIGFVLLAFSHNIQFAELCAVIAAIGGAAGDLLMLNVILKEVRGGVLGKIMSLRMMVLGGGHALGLMVAAPVFECGPALTIISSCGAIMTMFSILGAVFYAKHSYTKEEST
jgi:MFS family permease